MITLLAGLALVIIVILAIKLKDSEIRKSSTLKRLVVCATFLGVGLMLVGVISFIIGG